MLELAVWRRVPLDPVLLAVPVPGNVSGGVRDHVVLLLLVLVRPVMELSVELAAVQILDEVPHLAGDPHVLILGEEIHVTEGVNRDQRKVILGLAEMVEGMSELDPIRSQEADLTSLSQKLFLDQIIPLLDTLRVVRVVEQDDKGQALLS